MKLRNMYRQCMYDSSWDANSILAGCEQNNISPQKVVRAMVGCQYHNVPADKLSGALFLILLNDNNGS